jgi:hypothetical protein
MSTSTGPRREGEWAKPVHKLKVSDVPTGAVNLNVEGRQVLSPLQGFGALWQKTFRVRLPGITLTPAQVMQAWKAEFPKFQPPENKFYPPLGGLKPGEVIFISGKVPPFPGGPPIMPMSSGVMVLYVDDECFTIMTPEGFPEAGWNTFSTYGDEGVVVAQVQSMSRATDPLYEFYHRYLGSSEQQDAVWTHVLTALAAHVGVQGQVQVHKICLDPNVQWSEAKNIFQSAAIRTVFYLLGAPFRWIRRLFKPS